MNNFVLIGSNIAHSRSPRLHNFLFNQFSLPYRYGLLELGDDDVVPTVREMAQRGYLGANVTSPYKERVLAAMDDLSDEATAIGAVNTIVFGDGKATGFNTDAYAVGRTIGEHGVTASGFTAAVLGTGGAASAAIFALLREPQLQRLTVYSRSADRAQSEAARWNNARVAGNHLDSFAPADLVIHATSVGLPGVPGSVLSPEQLRGVRVVFEMIYSPAETQLIQYARAVGADVLHGMTMFLHQAVRSFELWTGIAVDVSAIPSSLFDTDTPL